MQNKAAIPATTAAPAASASRGGYFAKPLTHAAINPGTTYAPGHNWPMNLCVALGKTRSVLKGFHGIHILGTGDCLDSWGMQVIHWRDACRTIFPSLQAEDNYRSRPLS